MRGNEKRLEVLQGVRGNEKHAKLKGIGVVRNQAVGLPGLRGQREAYGD